MNCEEFRDAIVASIYGSPSAHDLEALRKHGAECPRCARVLERSIAFKGAWDPGDGAPFPDREESWRLIRERSFARPKRFALPLPWRRIAIAAAGVTAAVAVGAMIGRFLFLPPGERPPAGTPGEGAGTYESIASVPIYVETVELLLVDFANAGGRLADEESTRLVRSTVDEMLARTRYLKAAVIRTGDRELYDLLDDVEVALISISNLSGQNGETASQIERFIRDEALVPRLRALASDGAI